MKNGENLWCLESIQSCIRWQLSTSSEFWRVNRSCCCWCWCCGMRSFLFFRIFPNITELFQRKIEPKRRDVFPLMHSYVLNHKWNVCEWEWKKGTEHQKKCGWVWEREGNDNLKFFFDRTRIKLFWIIDERDSLLCESEDFLLRFLLLVWAWHNHLFSSHENVFDMTD